MRTIGSEERRAAPASRRGPVPARPATVIPAVWLDVSRSFASWVWYRVLGVFNRFSRPRASLARTRVSIGGARARSSRSERRSGPQQLAWIAACDGREGRLAETTHNLEC